MIISSEWTLKWKIFSICNIIFRILILLLISEPPASISFRRNLKFYSPIRCICVSLLPSPKTRKKCISIPKNKQDSLNITSSQRNSGVKEHRKLYGMRKILWKFVCREWDGKRFASISIWHFPTSWCIIFIEILCMFSIPYLLIIIQYKSRLNTDCQHTTHSKQSKREYKTQKSERNCLRWWWFSRILYHRTFIIIICEWG